MSTIRRADLAAAVQPGAHNVFQPFLVKSAPSAEDKALEEARLKGQMQAYRAAMEELSSTWRSRAEIHNRIWDLFKVAEAAHMAI